MNNMILCGTTPLGEKVYTNGMYMYTEKDGFYYSYEGQVRLKTGDNWKGIYGTARV